MARRKPKTRLPLPLSIGPLPPKLATQFAGQPLVFCDASGLAHGGLAAVLFENECAPAHTVQRTVALLASNELELHAALFALSIAAEHFPGRRFALFSDNQDAITRLQRAQQLGAMQDPALSAITQGMALDACLAHASLHWVKGHGRCRGNAEADAAARQAAAKRKSEPMENLHCRSAAS